MFTRNVNTAILNILFFICAQGIYSIAADSASANAAEPKTGKSSSPTTDLARYGTDPAATRLPETAVDTETVPNIVLLPDAPDDKTLPYYKIADNTYLLYGNIAVTDQYNRGWNGNAGFIVTPAGVLAIDALGTPKLGRRMIATIRSITKLPIKYLILTHNHPDHMYGAVAFRSLPDIKIISHKGTLSYYNSNTFEESAAYRKSILEKDMAGFKSVKLDTVIDKPVFDKITVKLGNMHFDIYNVGQHHSFGDLIVHQVESKIVWISDLAFNNRVTNMGDGHSKQSVKAINWLMKNFKSSNMMVPGHGSAQTKPFPMVTKTLTYITRLRTEMGKAFENGVGLHDAVKNSQFSEWSKLPLYDLNNPANAAHVYREMERELF